MAKAHVDFQPPRPHELLGVYADENTAQQVVVDLREKLHLTGRVGEDERDSLRAEMGEEMRETFLSPQAGLIVTKEAAKGSLWIMPICIAVGIAIMLPISLIWGEHVGTAGRWGMGLGIGAALGGTMGLVWMGLASKRPNEPMAAEKGVTVRVPSADEQVRQVMMAARPIRLDIVDDQGRPIETIATEPDDSAGKDLGQRMTNWP